MRQKTVSAFSSGNIKMALSAIRGARWRSLMTMFGITIGVVSVVTTISLGEGVKRQVIGQINHLGSDLITVQPGTIVNRSTDGQITALNFLSGLGPATLTEKDLKAIQETPNIKAAVPLNLITGVASADKREMQNGFIVSTTHDMRQILDREVEFGSFFESQDADKPVAVIGRRVAEQLFRDYVAIGKKLKIRGQEFVVRGVFEEFPTNPLVPNSDFNSAIFIPYESGKKLTGGSVQIYQILAKPADPREIDATISLMREALINSRSGQENFTILKQSESLAVANNTLNTVTGLIAGIAAISLLVGGIGIMNIMLVSVTERTQEIGIRKAVGATNAQIRGQFLVEAIVLSTLGGLIGVGMAILTNFALRIFTDLQPVITVPIILAAVGVSLLVGVVFGVAPALKAARKNPIDALRQ
jgi:ABC-type antimicrobial peptide transport system permease subunit